MARIVLPPMEIIQADTPPKVRQRMYDEYKAQLINLNPSYFNADGTRKGLLDRFKTWFRGKPTHEVSEI